MNCVHCNNPLTKIPHNTMTTILFHNCIVCGEEVAIDKGKIRKLKPNEKAFMRALQIA